MARKIRIINRHNNIYIRVIDTRIFNLEISLAAKAILADALSKSYYELEELEYLLDDPDGWTPSEEFENAIKELKKAGFIKVYPDGSIDISIESYIREMETLDSGGERHDYTDGSIEKEVGS